MSYEKATDVCDQGERNIMSKGGKAGKETQCLDKERKIKEERKNE